MMQICVQIGSGFSANQQSALTATFTRVTLVSGRANPLIPKMIQTASASVPDPGDFLAALERLVLNRLSPEAHVLALARHSLP